MNQTGRNKMAQSRQYDEPALYQIKVQGNLEHEWSDWFDGFAITQLAGDETLLVGPVTDQPALHGILRKILNLGLPLISVVRLEDSAEPPKV
jgi:hypothetical protein